MPTFHKILHEFCTNLQTELMSDLYQKTLCILQRANPRHFALCLWKRNNKNQPTILVYTHNSCHWYKTDFSL